MKVKYLRLSKSERKEMKKRFFETDTGKIVRKNLNHALICTILCFIIGIYVTYEAFFKTKLLSGKMYGISLIVLSIIGIIVYYKILIKKINEYVVKNK